MDRKIKSVLFVMNGNHKIDIPLENETEEYQRKMIDYMYNDMDDTRRRWMIIIDPFRDIYINKDLISQIIIKYEE